MGGRSGRCRHRPSLFLDEVVVCLRAWRPDSTITIAPEYQGISGHVYHLDFTIDRDTVASITPHHASVSSAARKLLDIRAMEAYSKLRIIVVVDDRQEREAAKREGLVLESVASVMMMMSALERRAGLSNASAS